MTIPGYRNKVSSSRMSIVLRRLEPLVWSVLLPLTSAILLAFTFPPWNYSILAWLSLIPFCMLAALPSARLEGYYGVYLGGLAFHLFGLDWIRTSYGGTGLDGTNALPWLLHSLVAACFWPAVLAVVRLLYRRSGSMAVALPAGWYLLEVARFGFSEHVMRAPYPWLQLGMSQVENVRLSQVADIGGVYFVGMIVAIANGGLFDLGRVLLRQHLVSRRRSFISALTALLVVAGAIVYGEYRLRFVSQQAPVAIWLIPPDISPLEESHALGGQAQACPEIWLWSEKAFSILVGLTRESRVLSATGSPGDVRPVLTQLEAAARERNATLLVGCATSIQGAPSERSHNSIVVIDPKRGFTGSYHKTHLVPWSEYVPYRLPGLPKDVNGHEPGDAVRLFALDTGATPLNCGLSICYDTCFPRLYRRYMLERCSPDMFMISSCERSDATGALPLWMLNHARFRAIETRRPMVRCVEGGYSGLIDSAGRVVAGTSQPTLFEPLRISSIPLDGRVSAYARYGDTPLAAMVCGVLLLALVVPFRASEKAPDQRPESNGWSFVSVRDRLRHRRRDDAADAPIRQAVTSGAHGFTLIELLIAIAIVGILLAITLVAVMRARETMDRAGCQNNLRQWGLGLANYSAAHLSWPPAVIWEPRGEPLGNGQFPIGVIDRVATRGDLQHDTIHANWAIMLLPYVDQQALAASVSMNRPISDKVNKRVREHILSIAVCPSDPYNHDANLYSRALPAGDDTNRYARGNYAINGGPDNYCLHTVHSDEPCVGGFYIRGTDLMRNNDQAWGSGTAGVNKSFRPADVKDGLSHTVLLDEIRAGVNELDPRGAWALGQIGSSVTARHGKHDLHSGDEAPADEIVNCAILCEDVGFDRLRREGMMCNPQNLGVNTRVSARSLHDNGVHVLLCDGAVRYINQSIPVDIWHALHTRDRGDQTEE